MRPSLWWSRPPHLLAMCDNVSYNWAAVLASLLRWAPPDMNMIMRRGRLLLADYERRRASPAKLWIWWLAGLGWLRSVLSSALLRADWVYTPHYAQPGETRAQCRCAGLSLPLCGLGSRSSLLAWSLSLSLSHYIIAMIWDQCAGRLYTRALPISVHTVPYDSCKLPPASCCYHRLYSDKKEMTRLLWSRHLHKLLKTSFLEILRSEGCKLSFNQTLRSSEKSVYEA